MLSAAGLDCSRNPEIRNDRLLVLEQDVLGLDIPVYDSMPVGVVQRLSYFAPDAERGGHREPSLAAEPRSERLSLNVGHCVPEMAAGFSGVMDREDVGV
jgi:hypothetical protein